MRFRYRRWNKQELPGGFAGGLHFYILKGTETDMNQHEVIIQAIEEGKIITILRGLDEDQLVRTCEAMEKGGIRLAVD